MPAKAGIHAVPPLDPGFRRGDVILDMPAKAGIPQ